MKVYSQNQTAQIIKEIKNGKIAVLPTDTIYGICASAFNKEAVERIYELRNRDKNKPCIVLIGKIDDLKKFGIKVDKTLKEFLKNIWPNKISVVLGCKSKKFEYLHRKTEFLAFRIPKDAFLLKLLKIAGPVIAPSANIERETPAKNIKEAQRYFGNKAIYVDGKTPKEGASTLIKIEPNFDIKILRKGAESGNKYFLMRHAEAISNTKSIISSWYPEKQSNPLTEKGKMQVASSLQGLKSSRIDLIISSPFLRTKQTSQIINNKLKIINHKSVRLIYDLRLKEIDCGVCSDKNISCYDNFAKTHIERYEKAFKNGESLRDVKIRMLEVIFEIEKKYENKNILIISHGHPLWALYGAMQGYSEEETSKHPEWNFKLAEIKKTNFLYNI